MEKFNIDLKGIFIAQVYAALLCIFSFAVTIGCEPADSAPAIRYEKTPKFVTIHILYANPHNHTCVYEFLKYPGVFFRDRYSTWGASSDTLVVRSYALEKRHTRWRLAQDYVLSTKIPVYDRDASEWERSQ